MPRLDEEKCLELLHSYNVPDQIVTHCRAVACVTEELATMCSERGASLDIGLAVSGALLHDIAKMECIENGCEHGRRGAAILEGLGLHEVARLVRQHVRLDRPVESYERPDEAMIVNYSDKRIRHTEFVTLSQRFEDLFARYGTTPQRHGQIEKMYRETIKMEELIFSMLDIAPDELSPGCLPKE